MARDAAAFLVDVRDANIPITFPTPHEHMGQDSMCSRNVAMSQEPSGASIPILRGSPPQNSLNKSRRFEGGGQPTLKLRDFHLHLARGAGDHSHCGQHSSAGLDHLPSQIAGDV